MVHWIIFLIASSLLTDTIDSNSALEGYCGIYNGKVCKKYLTGVGKVWFHNTLENPGGWLNERITADLWEDLIQKLKEPCRSAAE